MSVKLKLNGVFKMYYGATIFSAEEMTMDLNDQITDFNHVILFCDNQEVMEAKGFSSLEKISIGRVFPHRHLDSPRYFVCETMQLINLTFRDVENQDWYLLFN